MKGSTKPATITDCIARFVNASGPSKKIRAAREDVMGLFNNYLANYGEIASNVERAPLIVTAPISDLGTFHFRQFLSWYIIQKVLEPDKSRYAPVLRDFANWLIESKAISKKAAQEILEALGELQGEPERCEKLAELLYKFANRDMPTLQDWQTDPKAYAKKAAVLKAIHHEKPQRMLDGYFIVARVGPAALWLNPEFADEDDDGPGPEDSSKIEIGPVQVSPEAAKLARVGDRVSAAIGEMSGFWKLLETGGVYPT